MIRLKPWFRGSTSSLRPLAAVVFSLSIGLVSVLAQEAVQKEAPKPAAKSAEKPSIAEKAVNPAQIELLETKVRFESNGDSRKEVHTLVRINNEVGVQQFARLSFNFNRSFETVEIPFVRITHAAGGTADILPSAISDQPNPAVVNAPAYQDVRVKSVRILGLEPGDTLEYRVVRTVSHHPLAPGFWLDHTFDRSGLVTEEHFQVVLPSSLMATSGLIVVKNKNVRQQLEWRLYEPLGCGLCNSPQIDSEIDPSLIDTSLLRELTRKQKNQSTKQAKPAQTSSSPTTEEPLPPAEYGKVQLLVRPSASGPSVEKSGEGDTAETSYTWKHAAASPTEDQKKDSADLEDIPDIEIGRTAYWSSLSAQLYKALCLPPQLPEEVIRQSQQLMAQADTPRAKMEGIYNFVSQKIRTIDLPLGTTGFKPRPLGDILASGYATPEDKFFLFEALAKAINLEAGAALIGPSKKITALIASPAAFSHLVVRVDDFWLDPSLEVAPFGALPAYYRGNSTLILGIDTGYLADAPVSPMISEIPKNLPFLSSQKVGVDASLGLDGKLTTKVRYAMRGDNELVLRLAFHQSPKEKWKELAQLLSITDGFRGQVSTVNASDPSATKDPFTLEYEIEQPKFVDWSKKTLRIPALLPQLGLPDPPGKAVPGGHTPIELGTPLEVDTKMTLHLPPGTSASAPPGTSVERDYATYASQYSAKANTISASRHIHFVLRQIPGERGADYNAFLNAVQRDEAQDFTLERADNSAPKTNSAAPLNTAPPKPVTPKP